jgi:hypothetical protein
MKADHPHWEFGVRWKWKHSNRMLWNAGDRKLDTRHITCVLRTAPKIWLRSWNHGSIPRWDKRFFPSPKRSDRLWGPLSVLFNGHGAFYWQGVKYPGREADHSNPSSVKELVELSLHSLIRLHCVYRNFTFTKSVRQS